MEDILCPADSSSPRPSTPLSSDPTQRGEEEPRAALSWLWDECPGEVVPRCPGYRQPFHFVPCTHDSAPNAAPAPGGGAQQAQGSEGWRLMLAAGATRRIGRPLPPLLDCPRAGGVAWSWKERQREPAQASRLKGGGAEGGGAAGTAGAAVGSGGGRKESNGAFKSRRSTRDGPKFKSMMHTVSRLTMAQAANLAPSCTHAAWRGMALDQALEQQQERNLEMARHRRDTSRAWGRQGHFIATDYRKRLEEKYEDRHGAHQEFLDSSEEHLDATFWPQAAREINGKARDFSADASSLASEDEHFDDHMPPAPLRFGFTQEEEFSGGVALYDDGHYASSHQGSRQASRPPSLPASPESADASREKFGSASMTLSWGRATARTASDDFSLGRERDSEFQPVSVQDSYRSVGRGSRKQDKLTKLRRLRKARRVEFESRTPDEKARLKQAFASGCVMADRINARGVWAALNELGLAGRTGAEESAVAEVIRENVLIRGGQADFMDFNFRVVPKARDCLHELRVPTLQCDYRHASAGRLAGLDLEECEKCIRNYVFACKDQDFGTSLNFWRRYRKDFARTFQHFAANRGLVDLEAYQALVEDFETQRGDFYAQMERQVALLHGVPPSMAKQHKGELAILCHAMFRGGKGAQHADQTAKRQEVLACLFSSGVAPICGDLNAFAEELVQGCGEKDNIDFKDLLGVVDQVRKQAARTIINRLRGQHVKVSVLIRGLKLLEECCRCGSPEATAAVVENFSLHELHLEAADTSRESQRDDALAWQQGYVADVLRVVEKARAASRRYERAIAYTLGFSDNDLAALYKKFSKLTHTGALDLYGMRRVLSQISPATECLDEEIAQLMEDISKAPIAPSAPDCGEDTEEECLQISRKSSLWYDPSKDAGRKLELAVGAFSLKAASQVVPLRFDGYLRLCAFMGGHYIDALWTEAAPTTPSDEGG